MFLLFLTPHHSLTKQGRSYIQSLNFSLIFFSYFRGWDPAVSKKKQDKTTCYRVFQQPKVFSQAHYSGQWISKTSVSEECARTQLSNSNLPFTTPKVDEHWPVPSQRRASHWQNIRNSFKNNWTVLHMVAHVSLKNTCI